MARPPPQGTGILPQAVNKAGTGAPGRQQEGRPKRAVEGDPGGVHEGEQDTTENQRDQVSDG